MAKKKNIVNLEAGRYKTSMIEFLGHDTVKMAYDASIMAIEDAQHFSNEVRTKALQTAGLLMSLCMGVLAAYCVMPTAIVRVVFAVIDIVLALSLYCLLHFIIFRKENAMRGNVQSNMFGEKMIERMKHIDTKYRPTFLLASQLKGKEKAAVNLNVQTEQMQRRYEQIIWATLILLSVIFGIAIAFVFTSPVGWCA